MECFLAVTACKHHTSQDQCQSSFSSSEFFWKTARLLTPAVTFTNSRPVAVHRRRQAVTKMNEGGCEGGRARGEVGWTSLSISELHFQTGGPAAEPAGSTSSHHLSDCSELKAPALLLMNLFVSTSSAPSGGVLKQTCPLTRLPSSTSRLEENEKNTVKLKEKPRPQFQRHEK